MIVIKESDFIPSAFFRNVPEVANRRGNPAGKKRHYMNLVTAFDIETTTFPDIRQSIMYIWQWQLGPNLTVIGRTWEEFLHLARRIEKCIPKDRWLIVFVHNLAYEFQYIKGIYQFLPGDVFAIESRKPLKADMMGCIEFRCSYRLTNMSLDAFTRKMNVQHQKLSGEEFDYTKIRYPWTPLTDRELQYCINDVAGLVEAVQALMDRDGDTLQTLPLTSTGYVRRNVKHVMRDPRIHHSFIYSILPTMDIYLALTEAFRGGDTHANRYYTDQILKDVHSADRSSSYPAVMCNCEFPMSEFVPINKYNLSPEYISRCINIRHKALLLRIRMLDVKLRNPFWGCPYLSKSKCRRLSGNTVIDNGRVLQADYLETTITDIDLQIITQQYSGKITFLQGWYSTYKPLPAPLVEETISYYRQKTELKGVPGQELYYDKSKALLNSIYGMMVQKPVKPLILFQQVGDWEDDTSKSPEILLEENARRAFLAYQWGVWVTAHARKALQDGIRLVHDTPGAEFVYCDTDSVKYTGTVDWTGYNEARKEECLKSGAYATDPAGTTHYMGIYEQEADYYEFKTLGAKKYAYTREPGGKCSVTVAGVNKSKGGSELDDGGGLQGFNAGFTFFSAGGTVAIYNDDPQVPDIQVGEHRVKITSNCTLLPSTYKLGLTGEYERIIKFSKEYLHNGHIV